MRWKSVLLIPVAALIGCSVDVASTSSDQSNPLIGKKAPELAVDHWLNTAKPLALAALRGKVVVLDYWAYW